MSQGDNHIFARIKGESIHIVLTRQGIWLPRGKGDRLKRLPGMLTMLFGSSAIKKGTNEDIQECVDPRQLMNSCDGEREARVKLRRHARLIPYTSIIRCFLAKPGRISMGKLAFEFFDSNTSQRISKEFTIEDENFSEIKGRLRSSIPDRLEIH